MSTAFIVVGETGEYSDAQWWLVRAFDERGPAESFCKVLNDWLCENEISTAFDSKIDHRKRRSLKCPHDPQFQLDYTGANYYVTEVPKGVIETLVG